MVALPSPGSFLPRAGTNSSRGSLMENWLSASRTGLGGDAPEVLQIVGGVLTPTKARVSVDVEGGAASSDFLDTIEAGSQWVAGNILVLSPAADSRTVVVRNLTGNIILKTTAFSMASGWSRLWLEYLPPNFVELARDYGQEAAQQRADLGIGGTTPVAGQPSTYTHATGEQALAGTSETAAMTPAAVAVAMQSAALMIGGRGEVGDRTVNDFILIKRADSLFRMSIPTLLATNYTQFATTGELAIASASQSFGAHFMGGQPTMLRGYYRCKTAEHGYAIGMEVPVECTVQEEAWRRVVFGADAINWYYCLSATTAGVRGMHRNTGAAVTFTNANWRFFIRMWR